MKKIITLLVLVLMFHTAFSQWTNLNASMTQVRTHFGAVAVGDSGYAISGGGSGGYISAADVYSKPNNQWTSIQTYPGGDNNGTLAFAIGDTIYAGTGAGGGYNYSNTFDEFDVATQQWTGKTTSYNYQGRCSAVVFTIGDTGYVGGGLNSGYPTNNYSNNNPVNDFWMYVPATGVWDSIPHCPARGVGCNAVAFVLNGKAYIGTGGVQDAPGSQTFDPVADFWCYNPATNQWDSITPFGGGIRMGAVAFVTCGHAYVGTGCTDNGQSIFVNDVWAFDPNGGPTGANGPMGSWTQVSSFSGPGRMCAGAFVIGTHAYICGGGQTANGNLTFGDIWEYTPTPAFYANSPVCTGQQVQFTDTSLFFPDHWSWSFYGGTTSDSTVENPIVTYNTTGTYWVTLTAWNDCDTGTTTDTNYITVGSGGVLTILPLSATVCSGQSIKLIAQDTGSITWSPSTGLSATTGDSVVANPTLTTVYSATGSSLGSCPLSGTDTVKIIPAPPLTILPQDTSICNGSSVALVVPVSGTNYVWTPVATLSSSTGNNVIATPTVQTTYSVTGLDSLGCIVSDSDIIYIRKGVNKPVVSDTENVLTSTATQGNQWYKDGSEINGATGETYDLTDTGCYYTIATNIANGCSSISNTVCVTTLSGINRLSINPNQLSIYPNPTGGEIFVNISSSVADVKDWNLQISDVLGRTAYTRQSLNYSNDIDLSYLSGGVYFITVIDKTARAVVPVVKQ